MINRDISYEGNGSGYYTAEEVDKHQALVQERCPKAFLKRTTQRSGKRPCYVYQVRISTSWFTSKPLGDTHFFPEQAWSSAFTALNKLNG